MSDGQLLERVHQRLETLKAAGRFRSKRIVKTLPRGKCRIDARTVINLGGNDYLGLSRKLSTQLTGHDCGQLGSTASALVAGRTSELASLEETLSRFENTEDALVFPTGYAANLGVVTGLLEEGDAVWCDRDNHASIVDACRLSSAKLHVYRRDRLESLEKTLSRRRQCFDNVLLVTDGVFSMDGTIAPLPELCDIAAKFNASVIVDEAHGTGVLGRKGRGASEYCGVENRVLARIGTMSKAMGGLGGFVVSHKSVVSLLRNTARPQFFSTALPPQLCSMMKLAVEHIQAVPDDRQQLANLGQRLRMRIADAGLRTVLDGIAPIVPILVPGDEAVTRIAQRLFDRGYFTPAIRWPTVKTGTERLRLSFSVEHAPEDLDGVVHAIADVMKEVD